ADRTDAAVAAIEDRISGTDVRVQPVKLDLLDNATAAADSLTQLYFTVGMFAVAAGILLLVNIFVMLSDERRSEMGMMRALGLRRSPLVGAIATEGWMYSVVASAVGALIGIGVGRVIAWRADSILDSGNDLISLNLTFAFTWTTVATGFVIGLVISMSTILATSVRVSRLNVIAAIRDLPAAARVRLRSRSSTIGAVVAVLAVVWTVAALSTDQAFGVVVGPMIAVIGVAAVIARRVPTSKVVPVAAVVVLVWAATFVAALSALDIDVSITMFLVQGLGMAGAAVALVATQQERIGRALGRAAGGSLPVRIGLAYPTAKRFRTAMTLAMFAVVVLTLVYLAVLSHMFSNQLGTITAESSGGFGIVVNSNPTDPLDAEQLRSVPGVGDVAAMAYGLADFERDDKDPKRWPITGFSSDLLRGPPAIKDLGAYANADAAWRAVLADPDLVIVDDLFLATPGGPQTGTPRVGDAITVIDLVSGRQRALTVAAVTKPDFVGSGAWYGIDGYREVFGDRAVPSRFYVAPAGGADATAAEVDKVVQAIRTTFVAQGADAETVRARVDTILAQNSGFFTLMEQFVGVGLIVGIAGIGVLLVRAVRERRRDIGVLRSIGFTSRQVSRTFLIEASFIAFEGVAIGIVTALIGCYALVASGNNFSAGFEWSVPWLRIGFIAALAFGSAAAMALWPARRAAAIRPAVALRIAD
ncbi:MAG: ABC transporter permease, partial [Acidimicrobiia bacterium]